MNPRCNRSRTNRQRPVRGTIFRWGVAGLLSLASTAVFAGVAQAGDFRGQQPERLLDTRESGTTVDGSAAGGGAVAADSTLRLKVAGRGSVPTDVDTIVLNVAVAGPAEGGYLTVFDCDEDRPIAANVNYAAGQVTSNAAVSAVSESGEVCIYSYASTHLIVDTSGSFPTDVLAPTATPRRMLDTRSDGVTIDGAFAAGGAIEAGTTLRVPIAGRGGIPVGADSVVMNMAVVRPQDNGYVTAFPCGESRPTTASLNYERGVVRPNLVVGRLGDGDICVYVSSTTEMVIDVAGSLMRPGFVPLDRPARFVDTRPSGSTVDGALERIQIRSAGSATAIPIAGRGGVPLDATGVVMNLAVVGPVDAGYATVHPRGADRPTTSSLNFLSGQTLSNAVIVPLGGDGEVCLFTKQSAHYVLDVVGYLTGPASDAIPAPGTDCDGNGGGDGGGDGGNGGQGLPPGTYTVGTDIEPGRYEMYSDGPGFCDWEPRDANGDEIEGEFARMAGRFIVDILATDATFDFPADCGSELIPYSPPADAPSTTTIEAGYHVVGDHIAAGVWKFSSEGACYWERLTSFDRSTASVIDNDFVAEPAGEFTVTVEPTDVGFLIRCN